MTSTPTASTRAIADELVERLGRACSEYEHGSVGPVLRAAAKPERSRALGRAGAKPDALDAPADANAARRLE
jgi:hypothetical protein